jgi:hypothetical protein
MMPAQDREILDQLRAQVQCAKRFVCVESELRDLCKGEYHSDLDILECQEPPDRACPMARPFGCTRVCTCPLRKFIAKNFGRWSAPSTTVLRQSQPG